MIKCVNCPNTLWQGQTLLCGPCIQLAAASHNSRDTTPFQRAPPSKVIAAVQSVHKVKTSQCLPKGDHQYWQIQNKACRDNNQEMIGKKCNQNGYGAAAKPPPFQKLGILSTSHLGGTSISLGFHILFGSTFCPLNSNPKQQFQALLAVNLTHYNLADFIIKRALLKWPPASPNPLESHYPWPPSDYSWDEELSTQFFKLGKIPWSTSNTRSSQ